MLELQASLAPVGLALDDHIGGHEAEHVKVLGKLRGVPNLAVTGFEALPLSYSVVRFNRAVNLYQPLGRTRTTRAGNGRRG